MATPTRKSAGKPGKSGKGTARKGREKPPTGKGAGKLRAAKAAPAGKRRVARVAPKSRKPTARKPAAASARSATRSAASKTIARVLTVAGRELAKASVRALMTPKPAKVDGNGLPRPSEKPWGEAGRALDGVRVLDFTHVQSGPTCTQLLGYMGADVIKIERPGVGDITRGQLRDVPDADSLYFTMLNGNKRSITIDSKNPKGKEILDRLIKYCDVLVENFAPGALDRMGLTWEHIHELNPRMIVASVKGFGPGPYEDCKVYENVAQCAGGSASTTGFRDGPPLVTGAQIGDSGTGLHLALGIVAALYQRNRTGRGQKVLAAMQDGVLNLCRVKLRDQQRLAHGPLKEYSQFGEGIPFGQAVPRAGNDSGGGQPGWILKCKGWETDPDAYIYFITQAPVWEEICDLIGRPEWKTDPDYAKPPARLPRLRHIFATIEEWTKTKTKFEVMELCNERDIPVGPILSMKEVAEEPSLRATGTVVEVDHPTRGKYLTVGNPIKMSDSPTEVRRSPLLGEHTEEILRTLGYDDAGLTDIHRSGAIGEIERQAAE
jgi:formyl-CoA transferase